MLVKTFDYMAGNRDYGRIKATAILIHNIKNDKKILASLKVEAIEQNISLDSMIIEKAYNKVVYGVD